MSLLINKKINICGSIYTVDLIDRQIMFYTNDGMHVSRFAFEFSSCIWVFYPMDAERIYADDIIGAYQWLQKSFEIIYNDGVGKLNYIGG